MPDLTAVFSPHLQRNMFIVADSSRVNSRILVDAMTTTIMFTRSTKAASQAQTNPTIPVAAIAGGILAGALLAVAVTVAWVHRGKSLKRGRHQWKEVEASHEPKLNTVQNTGLSKPHILSYQPLFSRPLDRKVKFARSDETRARDWESGSAATLIQGMAGAPFDRVPKVSKPRPLRSGKGSSHLSSLGVGAMDHIPGEAMTDPQRIVHKPSTVSSSSMYSAASGEEHQVRAPPNLILAAMDELGMSVSSSGGGGRRSVASSSWSFLSRMTHGVQGNIYRYSQASSRSAYTVASRDSSGAPVGLAL